MFAHFANEDIHAKVQPARDQTFNTDALFLFVGRKRTLLRSVKFTATQALDENAKHGSPIETSTEKLSIKVNCCFESNVHSKAGSHVDTVAALNENSIQITSPMVLHISGNIYIYREREETGTERLTNPIGACAALSSMSYSDSISFFATV